MFAKQDLTSRIVDSSVPLGIFLGFWVGGLLIIFGAFKLVMLLSGLLFLFLLFKSPFFGLCILLFSLPFSGILQLVPGGMFFNTINKMLAYVIVLAFMFNIIKHNKLQKIKFSNSIQWFFVFSLWCLVSLLWTYDQTESIKSLLVRLNILGFAFLVSVIPNGLKQFKTLCLCATAGAASLGIYVSVLGLDSLAGEYGKRLAAGTNANVLAHTLAIGLLLSVIGFKDSKKITKVLIVIFDLFILYAIALTGSRGTWVALVFSAVFVPLFFPGIELRRKLTFSFGFSLVTLFVYFGITKNFFGEPIRIVFERIYLLSPQESGGRINIIWPFYWEKFCESPIFGSGLGSGHFASFAPHNDLLFILSEFGIIGFLFFTVMQLAFFKDSVLIKDSSMRLLVFVLLLFLFMAGLTHTTVGMKSYAVAVGVFSFLGNNARKTST
jgi:O-antigen ligase